MYSIASDCIYESWKVARDIGDYGSRLETLQAQHTTLEELFHRNEDVIRATMSYQNNRFTPDGATYIETTWQQNHHTLRLLAALKTLWGPGAVTQAEIKEKLQEHQQLCGRFQTKGSEFILGLDWELEVAKRIVREANGQQRSGIMPDTLDPKMKKALNLWNDGHTWAKVYAIVDDEGKGKKKAFEQRVKRFAKKYDLRIRKDGPGRKSN